MTINKPAPTWKKLFRIRCLNQRLMDKNLSQEKIRYKGSIHL